jgi:ACS family hexuronate transporter-like MFS transporter
MTIRHMRWVLAGLLFLSTTINYIDRQAIGIVSVDIRREFHLNEQDYSHILFFFFVAYAFMYAGSGYLLDRLGTRRGFAAFITGWSIAQMLHGFAIGKWSLAAFRFLLGFTEPGAFPAAAKAVAEWFPPKQRALAMGIFNAGTAFGSVLAPAIVAFLTLSYGWRSAFVITGATGLVWLVLWLSFYYSPAANRWLKPGEAALLQSEMPAAETPPQGAVKLAWGRVVRMRGCWSLALVRFFTDPVNYFVVFWLPEYLRKERAFDLTMVGKYAPLPFVCAGIAYVAGGWLSGRLIAAGWTVPRARKFAMAVGAAMMPVAIAAPLVPSAALAIVATCFVTSGHAIWSANLQTIPADVFRGPEVGTVTGFSGMGGAVGGALAQLVTGYVVAHFSYAPVFLLAGLMHPLSALLVYRLLPDEYFQEVR